MKITKIIRVIFLLLAAAFLAYAFWSDGQRIAAGITLIWLLFWGFSLNAVQDYAPSVFFTVYGGACLIGSLMGLQVIFVLVGFIAALSAWDIDRFILRWRSNKMDSAIEKSHLLRLLAVDVVGFLLVVIGLSYRIQLSFMVMLLIGAAAVISLNWFIGLLRTASSKK